MNGQIKYINHCPVKSLSIQSIKSCGIKRNIGISNDRIFAFSRGIDNEVAKYIEKNPKERKLNNFLTLKNSPVLNKYNFNYSNNKLTLSKDNVKLISISPDIEEERILLCNKLSEIEVSLIKPIFLLKNNDFPFYDTSHSSKFFNSMSLVNLNSIKDFENKISDKIEFQRFRANFYIDEIGPWEENSWIGKVIKINNVSFKVEKNIPRCVAINLKPKTEDNSLNLLNLLKKNYNNFDMGIYLTPLNDGKIELENKIII